MTPLIGNLSNSTSFSSSFVATLSGNKRIRDGELKSAAEILHPNKKIKVERSEALSNDADFAAAIIHESTESFSSSSQPKIKTAKNVVLKQKGKMTSDSSYAEMRNVIRKHNHNIPAMYKQALQNENEELRKLIPFSEQIVPRSKLNIIGIKTSSHAYQKLSTKTEYLSNYNNLRILDVDLLKKENLALRNLAKKLIPPINTDHIPISVEGTPLKYQFSSLELLRSSNVIEPSLSSNNTDQVTLKKELPDLNNNSSSSSSTSANSSSSTSDQPKPQLQLSGTTRQIFAMFNAKSYDDEEVVDAAPQLMPQLISTGFFDFLNASSSSAKSSAFDVQIPISVPLEGSDSVENVDLLLNLPRKGVILNGEMVVNSIGVSSSSDSSSSSVNSFVYD